MNRQPYTTPPRIWEPRMTPWFVRVWFPLLRREMFRVARIEKVDVSGAEHVRAALVSGAGVLVTPNHSFHYDSYVLGHAAHEIGRPFHFLTAWQVFAMSSRFNQWVLQRHGCFSIDRESADLGAFKRAVEILRSHRCPLAIFPEGDIYHTNDRVMPFREGAAAIALSAAKRADRPIVAVPCAIKCRYMDDPTPGLLELMNRLERSLHWRPRPELPLPERIYRFAEGVLALKELEYMGSPQRGTVRRRTARLMDHVLSEQESRHSLQRHGDNVPERVKDLRRHHILRLEQGSSLDAETRRRLERDMEDLFFVIQLYSYPGDYVAERPTIERLAETLDKFEEDLLDATYPKPRGSRHATVRFGEPISITAERSARNAPAELTTRLETAVQELLNHG